MIRINQSICKEILIYVTHFLCVFLLDEQLSAIFLNQHVIFQTSTHNEALTKLKMKKKHDFCNLFQPMNERGALKDAVKQYECLFSLYIHWDRMHFNFFCFSPIAFLYFFHPLQSVIFSSLEIQFLGYLSSQKYYF